MKSIVGILAAAALIAAADVAVAEVDLFDIQKDILLGKTTVTAPAGTKEADLAAIAECLEDAKGITLDLSGTKIKTIPDEAFEECTALKSVVLPKGVSSIGESAFYRCESLTSVKIPASVTSIGWSAFSNCKRLTSVVISEGVTSIGRDAFGWCESLTSVVIPASVTSIEESAFKFCDKLTKIDIAPESKSYVIVDGVLFSKDKKSLVCFPAGRSDDYYEIPDGTVNIAGAFYGCKNLKAVKIPEGVTSIGWGAFDYCTSLTSVEIPKSVTSIGGRAFINCDSLTTVTFGDTGGWYADKELTKSVPAGQLASYMKRGGSLYKRLK